MLLLASPTVAINWRDADGMSALSYACSLGCVWLVQMLLEHGADARSKEIRGMNGLQLAVSRVIWWCWWCWWWCFFPPFSLPCLFLPSTHTHAHTT